MKRFNPEPHNVFGGKYPPKHPIRKILYIRKDQILGDIDASIELVATTHTREDGSPMPVFQNALERYKSLFDRWINKYFDKTKERVAAYLTVPIQKGSMNAKLDWKERELHLLFPFGWDETTFDAMSGAVHDYIVNSVLAEFFAMTITSKDPITVDKLELADDAYSNIKRYTMVRTPEATLKKLHPF